MTVSAAQCSMATKAFTQLALCAALAGCGDAEPDDADSNGGADQGGAAGSSSGRGATGGKDAASGAGMANWSGGGSDAGRGNASGQPSAGSGGTSRGGQANAGSSEGGAASPNAGAGGAAMAGRGMGGGGRNAGGGRVGVGGGGRSSTAGSPSSGGSTAQAIAQEYVDAHNAVRAAVEQPANYTGTWMPLPPVTWSPEVAATAQAWAENLRDTNSCGLRHAQNTGYGENLAGGSGKMTPSRAVELWAGEKEDYTYNPKYAFEAGTGHYTQIVWRTSVQIGCGSATCSNGSTVICCRYSPPGNYIGRAPY